MTPRIPHNLMPPARTFTGRDAELAALADLVDAHRVTHLTGPSGIGKTELARTAGHRILAQELFPGGVFHLSLEGATGVCTLLGDLVFHTGIDETKPLTQALAGPSRLVIWDQMDGVLERLPDLVRHFFGEETAGAENVHHLLVHRAPVDGEPALALGPLGADAAFAAFAAYLPGTVSQIPEPGDPALAEALEHLGGNPFAIRLAARWCRPPRWTNVLPEGLDATRDRRPRGPDAAVAAGLALAIADLDEPARRLMGILAALPAGAAEPGLYAMFGEELEQAARHLERSGLLDVQGDRHTLHPAARSVVPALLGERQAGTLWQQAAYYLQQVLMGWKTSLALGEPNEAHRFVVREWENLRAIFNAALDRLARSGVDEEEDARLAMNCGGAMFNLMYGRGMYREGLTWMAACRPIADRLGEPMDVATFLDFTGLFEVRLGHRDAARGAFESSIAVYRGSGPPAGLGSACYHLGLLLYEQHDSEAAAPCLAEAVEVLRATQGRAFAAQAGVYLGLIQLDQGEAGAARETLDDALSLFEEHTQDPWLRLRCRFALAEAAARTGDAEESRNQAGIALADLFRTRPKVMGAGTPLILRLAHVYLDVEGRAQLAPFVEAFAKYVEGLRRRTPRPDMVQEWRLACEAMDRVAAMLRLVGTAFGPATAAAPEGARARDLLPEAARALDEVSGAMFGAERWVKARLAAG
jgi:tetratricopeptide (TPR) repeat protein